MKLYVCAVPISFPRSEYGGVVVVIAKSPKQLGKILTEKYADRGAYFDLSISVKSVKWFSLDPERDYTPGVVYEFIT